MESIRALINKLHQQAEEHADAFTLMNTVQAIQDKLARLTAAAPRQLGTSKVAVMLPAQKFAYSFRETEKETVTELQPPVGNHAPYKKEPVHEHAAWQPEPAAVKEPHAEPAVKAKEPVKMPVSHPVKEPEREVVLESLKAPVAEPVKHTVTLPVQENAKEKPAMAPVPATTRKDGRSGWSYDPSEEFPTLTHQKDYKEMNDTFEKNGTSLNDVLKTEKNDLAAVLKEGPIRDLKKAIGINDRFVFLAELFRGDEAMYERSIKTINNFRIYQEAEYWIERELKVKQGWDEKKEAVKQFRQLVRRRFL